MTSDQITNFLEAAESANINVYSFSDDTNAKYYRNDNSICIYDENTDTLVNIKKSLPNGIVDNNSLMFTATNISDIRKAEVCGTYEQIKLFAEEYGLTLSNDDLSIIVKIDRNNRVIKPITGGYENIYHKLSEAEYDALSDEEKAKYDAIVNEDKKRLEDIPVGRAAIINC